MYINYKPLAVFLRMIIAMGGTLLLLARLQIFTGGFQVKQVGLFSTIMLFVAVVYYYVLSFWQINNTKKDKTCIAPWLKGTILLSFIGICAVDHFLINGNAIPNWQRYFVTNMITYVMPALLLLDYLLFDKKGSFKLFFPFIWLIPEILYTVYVYVVVLLLDGKLKLFTQYPYPFEKAYPYTFYDVVANGNVNTVATLLMIFVCFVAIGFMLFLLDLMPIKLRDSLAKKKSDSE